MTDHRRLALAYLRVDNVELRLRYADVVTVTRDDGSTDWECLAYDLDDRVLPAGPYHLEADTVEGLDLRGDAILVRSVDGAHVFRGVGELAGAAVG